MESQGISGNFSEANVDALAVVVFKDEKASDGALQQLDNLTGGHISAVIKSEEFKGDVCETCLLRITPQGKVKATRLLLVGGGERAEYKASDVAVAAGTAATFGAPVGASSTRRGTRRCTPPGALRVDAPRRADEAPLNAPQCHLRRALPNRSNAALRARRREPG